MSAWRSYRKELKLHTSDQRFLSRVIRYAEARIEYRRVRHANFEQLFTAGYEVQTIDDCAIPIDLEGDVLKGGEVVA